MSSEQLRLNFGHTRKGVSKSIRDDKKLLKLQKEKLWKECQLSLKMLKLDKENISAPPKYKDAATSPIKVFQVKKP